jgi:hypothetical protein
VRSASEPGATTAAGRRRAARCHLPAARNVSLVSTLSMFVPSLSWQTFSVSYRMAQAKQTTFPHLPAATPRPAGHPHNHTCRNISFNSTFRMRPSRACLGKYSGFSIKQRHKDLETFLSLRTSQGPALRHAMAGGDRPPCGKRHF